MNRIIMVSILVIGFGAGLGRAETTLNATNFQAYGANVGWINARGDVTNGAVIGAFFCTGYLWSANCGWINLGNGPTNGWQYSNVTATDWGVNHDGQGRLSGYAYGANVGWINFEQAYGKPVIDLLTGILTGHAWGANIGWFSLSNAPAFVQTDRLSTGADSDGDGLPDAYEYRYTNSLVALGAGGQDADGDGATDLQEAGADTDPFNSASRFQITEHQRLVGTNHLTWTIQPTRFYRIEHTPVLTNNATWPDSGLGQLIPATGSSMTRDIVDSTATGRFYRIKALVPLSE
jgi:hypothetical protein